KYAKRGSSIFKFNYATKPKEISNEVRNAARDSFFDFLDECKTNPESFHRLINLLYQEQVLSMSDRNNNQRFQQSLFRILAESSTTVTNHKISKFEKLLKDRKPEEEYQIFLMDNPVFLNPLASKLIPKKKLGEEFITDYVLETLSSEYILVEIEKPSDQIFTKSNDFHHKFTHAFGQVLDFIEWVEQNIAYAQKKLPNISSPTGLLIIGMREYLNDEQIKKLNRFNKNSSKIKVLTFDDLLFNTKQLQNNIRARVKFNT
ncbi:Shedu anti-phage system protein SduA domain-containing protein, partial [Vibrio atlanticus]